jgi:hypothetical protein
MGEQHTKCKLIYKMPISIGNGHRTVIGSVNMPDVIYPVLGFDSSLFGVSLVFL